MNEAEIEYLKQIIKVEKVAYIAFEDDFRSVVRIAQRGGEPVAVFNDGLYAALMACSPSMFICYSEMEPIE